VSTRYFPNLTAKVHMALVNAGTSALSTAQIADRAGVPVGDGGWARSLVWRELDMLVRHGLAERVKKDPDSRFVLWRRVSPAEPLLDPPAATAAP